MAQKSISDILVKCADVGVEIGNHKILSSVSVEVCRGDRIALLGPSGCGKSTLLNVLAGLLPASEGTLNSTLKPGDVSIVFQEPSLLPWKTVAENVQLLLSLNSTAQLQSDVRQKLRDVLTRVGLWERRGAFPDELSGGMKMRVALARALLMSPRLLLLDEPFSALDDFTREKLQDDLLQLYRSSELSYVLVTHNMEEAALLAERILVFSPQGKIVAELRVSDFSGSESIRRDSKEVSDIRSAIRSLWQATTREATHA
ncbi:MAG: ABC transporter ATP-binding protein [Betaproteobacteria bacterium]|nr:ABC transporter ATP-binding protein [Betaproteobacteria bacterium]